jgi:hypothetical protein
MAASSFSTSFAGSQAVFAQVVPNPGSILPMIGASGAISGVLGAYMLLFPHARVLLGLPLGFLVVQLGRFPAIWVLAAWFGMQLIMGRCRRVAASRRIGRRRCLRRTHRRLHRRLLARHNFQTAQRSFVAALLRRCYIPRTLRARKFRAHVLGS